LYAQSRLARLLQMALLWTLAAAGASAGCLVTDPVPYEPPPNTPPLILTQSDDLTPDPLNPVEATYERDPISGEVIWDPISFSVPVRDDDRDDRIQCRVVVWTPVVGWRLDRELPLIRSGGAIEGTVTFTLSPGSPPLLPASLPNCVKVVLAVTDAGFGAGPPFWTPPLDDQDRPLTEVALLAWWLLVPNPDSAARPTLDQCESP
jgi:hypothetical protein